MTLMNGAGTFARGPENNKRHVDVSLIAKVILKALALPHLAECLLGELPQRPDRTRIPQPSTLQTVKHQSWRLKVLRKLTNTTSSPLHRQIVLILLSKQRPCEI